MTILSWCGFISLVFSKWTMAVPRVSNLSGQKVTFGVTELKERAAILNLELININTPPFCPLTEKHKKEFNLLKYVQLQFLAFLLFSRYRVTMWGLEKDMGHELSNYAAEDAGYFAGYTDFSTQANMLDDNIRTSAYYDAIMAHKENFKDKTVIDVGTGTGILALFAAKAGAKKVYALEGSPELAKAAKKVVQKNGFEEIIEVISGKVEHITLPEQADIIVSEPMGFWLLNEQMIQTYLIAKEKWLKPNGMMFPESAHLYIAPLQMDFLHQEMIAKNESWLSKENFYNLDLSSIFENAKIAENARIIVDQIPVDCVLKKPESYYFDFKQMGPDDIKDILFNFKFSTTNELSYNALGMWFDVNFPALASGESICLSTAPNKPLTHWYQSIFLLPKEYGGNINFEMQLHTNHSRTYDFDLFQQNTEKELIHSYSFLNPVYRYYNHYDELNFTPESTDFPE